MKRSWQRQLVRHFPENGIKLLLENRLNVRGRRLPLAQFGKLVEDVTATLEQMPLAERMRRQELLSYLEALVYHERERAEYRVLLERIESAARSDLYRKEVKTVFRSMADEVKAAGRKEGLKRGEKKGEIRGRQEALLEWLQVRFGEVPKAVTAKIKGTRDIEQLKSWSQRAATADSLADVGITQ